MLARGNLIEAGRNGHVLALFLATAIVFLLLVFAPTALAGPPTHTRQEAQDIEGFDHACGIAIDSEGDAYVTSAGETPPRIRIFDPGHAEIGSITEGLEGKEPCGLAVDSNGNLYVTKKAVGEVVKYHPTVYPFSGPPSYAAPVTIVPSSGGAKGIAVDPNDDRLYVAEGARLSIYNADGSFGGLDETDLVNPFQATGGSYTLSFEDQETGPIAWDASDAQVRAALEGLSTIGAGNVEVSAGSDAHEHIVSFTDELAYTDLPSLEGNGENLTGGTLVHLTVRTNVNGFSGRVGEEAGAEYGGVAVYSYILSEGFNRTANRYVFAADSGSNEVKVFGGSIQESEEETTITELTRHRTLSGPAAGEGFGFGPAGAYLAVDPGNRDAEGKCTSVAEQACTAGHFYVYDDAAGAVEEFDASGEYLDRFSDPAFTDAEPTAIAVDRSGGAGDGTVYVTAEPGAGATLLAFGPLSRPSRLPLEEPISHLLANAQAVATDRYGDVYAAAGPEVVVFDPGGDELASFEDPHIPLEDLAVDSSGKVYVLEGIEAVTYYAPSQFPPVSGTTYSRHEPVATQAEFPSSSNSLRAVAVDPGPGPGKDHLFVTSGSYTHEYASATGGSGLLDAEVAKGLFGGNRQSIAVAGRTGTLAFGMNANRGVVGVADLETKEATAEFTGAGCPKGPLRANPYIAVDQADGHVVAFDNSAVASEFDAGGGCVAEFPEGVGNFTEGLSRSYRVAVDSACALHEPPLAAGSAECEEFDPANGNVYVAFDDTSPQHPPFDVTAFGPLSYGEPPVATTGIASGVNATGATLNGTVDPRGFELEECSFEWDETEAYVHAEPCMESIEEIGQGSGPVAVHLDISGIEPEATRYHFRLRAKNKYGEGVGDDGLFGPPSVTAKSAVPILYTETTLRANVETSGLATSYRFEYGTTEGVYDKSTAVKQLSGEVEGVDVQATIGGLAEGTTYYFRAVAENEAAKDEGSEGTFTTLERLAQGNCANGEYRTGPSSSLPDCRAYELVTPAQTNGLSPVVPPAGTAGFGFNNWLAVPRGVGAGERVTYYTRGSLPGFEGNGRLDGYRAERGEGAHPEGGWENRLIGPSFVQAGGSESSTQGVSASQSHSFWSFQPGESLEGTLEAGVYLRGPDGFANPACNPEPGQAEFELVGCGSEGTDPDAVSKFIASPGELAIFTSKAHLEEGAPPEGTIAIYERAVGASAAGVLSAPPAGASPATEEEFEEDDASYVGATEDGSAVLFRVNGALYLRRTGQTIEVAAQPNTFAGIAADGGRVFYAKAATGTQAAELFACDTQTGPCAGAGGLAPTPVGPAGSQLIFVGVSPDGARAFFLSTEVLTATEENERGEHAEPGADNVYVWDAGSQVTRFVAVLDSRDLESFGGVPNMALDSWSAAVNPGAGPGSGRARSPVRSTPDGAVFVFQSHARLTAYDNEGVGEIYRYAPAAAPGERLLCISCDPGNAPPGADAMLEALSVTGHTTPLQSSNAMIDNVTDDGRRVFFGSSDRLLPEDANHVADVYEWQAKEPGGSCKHPGGCLALISSGQGDTPSYLYGMSADGHDVFFSTQEKLGGADVAGSPSIYDAREEGGTPEALGEEVCHGDACQGEGSTPSQLSTPASTGPGGGNLPAEPVTRPRCPKGKRKVRRAGRVRCVKRHARKRHRGHHHRGGRNYRSAGR